MAAKTKILLNKPPDDENTTYVYSPYGHDNGQPVLQVPVRYLGQPEDGEGEDEVEQVEGGQRDQKLVEVGPHLGAREHEDAQDVA